MIGRHGSIANLVSVPLAFSESERLSLQLNLKNVFDKYYYGQLHFFHVVPGEGRTALLTLNFNY